MLETFLLLKNKVPSYGIVGYTFWDIHKLNKL